MKRDFSFYEFVGVLTPSVIFLYFLNLMLEWHIRNSLFNYSELGSSVVFLIIAYGVGQVMHALGNLLEKVVWTIFKGRPTQWLTRQPTFGQQLFDQHETDQVLAKLHMEFGPAKEKDYGRLALTKISINGKTDRIDIFNGNYSLFRALSVSFMLLIACSIPMMISWIWVLSLTVLLVLSLFRMVRFGKYYAQELYRTYLIS